MREERISKTKAALMIVVAAGFDLLQFGTVVIFIMGLMTSVFFAWIPFIGAAASAAIMFVATAIQSVFSWIIIGIGYLTLTFWFLLSGVSFMKGEYMTRRVGSFFAALIIDLMPFLNILPGITIWTIIQIYLVRHEDADEKKREREKSQLNTMRVQRTFVQPE